MPNKNNKKRYNNQNKKQSRPYIKSDNKSDDYIEEGKSNDVSWYAANPQLLRDAASIPFSNALGTTNDVGVQPTLATSTVVPGIQTIRMFPTVGSSLSPDDPINVAARNINSWVRHANSGSRNYESSDIMMCILASHSVFTYIAFLERLYGLALVYAQSNRYLALHLLEAQVGTTIAQSIISNLSDFRYWVNYYVTKASVMCVPKGLTVLDRQLWLNSHVWADGTNLKHQIYIPMLDRFYQYNPSKYNFGGCLEYVAMPRSGTYTALFTTLSIMLNKLIADDDINLIWGDITKAYGDGNLYKLAPLPEEYTVIAEYNEEVLSQFNNLDTIETMYIGMNFSGNTDAVVQSNNVLYSCIDSYMICDYAGRDVSSEGTLIQAGRGKFFTLKKDSPDPSDIMVASRLTLGGTQEVYTLTGDLLNTTFQTNLANSDKFKFIYGTEVVYQVEILTLNPSSGVLFKETTLYTHMISSSLMAQEIGAIVTFDYHPLITLYDTDANNDVTFTGIISDLQNYTILKYSDLKKIHYTAIMNEFAIPQLGIVK